MYCLTLLEGPPKVHVCFFIFSEFNHILSQKMFGGLKDVERYEKQFKEATLPYTNESDHVNTSKAKYHQDKGGKNFEIISNKSDFLKFEFLNSALDRRIYYRQMLNISIMLINEIHRHDLNQSISVAYLLHLTVAHL